MTRKKMDGLEEIFNKEPANDIFSEFDELDEISITEEESPISNYSDLINEAKAKKNLLDEVADSMSDELDIEEEIEDFNKTKEIDNLKDQVLEKLEELENEDIEDKTFKEIKKENIPNEEVEEDPRPFRTAFIYTSIIGFIILFICYGIYLYLLSQ